ncbi:ribonuclease H-like domain-containing protein [Tanacetum coccineum]
MTSPIPSPTFSMPTPSPTFSFPSTSEPVFSVSTSEPAFESPNSQTSQNTQSQQQFQQYHTTTVSNNNAKFPYLKKDEYETWAMKMEYWIMNSDHNLWNIVLNGNSRKKTGRDPKGNIMILPPVSVEEHIAVQRETKARTILLQSLPEDHMADLSSSSDAKGHLVETVKARFGGNDESKKMRKSMLKQEFSEFRVSESEGLHKGYDRFQKILSQLNQMQAKPDNEDCNMKFLRALLPTPLVTGGYTLKQRVESSYDSRGTSAPTHSAFISAASTNSKMSYADSQNQPPSITFTTASSSADASSNVIESVLHSFVAESDPQQQITYEDFDQIGKLDLEELDIKLENTCSMYSAFKLKELDKSEEPKALLSVDSMLNWSDHEGEDVEKGAAQVYGMIAGDEDDAATGDDAVNVSGDVSDAAAEFALMGLSSQVHTCPFGCEYKYAELKKDYDNLQVQYKDCYIQVQAYKSTLQTLEQQKGWYQLKLEQLETQDKLEESEARFDKWKESSKNLNKLINSSMSTRTKFGLGYGETFGSDEVFDPSAPIPQATKTNEHLASAQFRLISRQCQRLLQKPSSTIDDPSFSFKENVKTPRNICNKSGINNRSHCKINSFGSKTCFVCGSKFHLIKDCDFYEKQLGLYNKPMWNNVANIPSFVPRAASVPAGSRNQPASVTAGSAFPAGSRNRPATVSADRHVPAGSSTRPAPVSAGLAVITNCIWMREDGELLLRPQQVVLGKLKGHICNGDPRTMENPHKNKDLGIVDSGCSRSMMGNKEKLDDFVKIIGECLVLTKEFQLPENNQVVLRVPRRHNLYSFNLTEIQPERDITCLLAKASSDESTKWHRRMAHVNFKNINKLAKHGLVNGLPSKLFTNEHNCVACNKGKQHKASYKAITAVSTISEGTHKPKGRLIVV